MHDMQVFQNDIFGGVRVLFKDGEPMFCAFDVCNALGLENGRDSIWKIFPKGVDKIYTLTKGGNQLLSYLTEMQLYKFIMRSNAKNAEPFQDWVCGEVLPSIRRTGKYEMQQTPKIPQDIEEVLEMALELARDRKRLLAQVAEDAPKVECYNALMDSNDCLDFGHFAKNIGLGRNILFRKLRDIGVLMRDNIPYQEYMDRGYFRVVEGTYSNGGYSKIYQRTLITPKGQDYLQRKLGSGVEVSLPAPVNF